MRLITLTLSLGLLASGCASSVDGSNDDFEQAGSPDAGVQQDDPPELPEEDQEEPSEEPEEEPEPEPEPEPTGCPTETFPSLPALTEPAAGVQTGSDGGKVHFVWGMAEETIAMELDLWDGYGAFAGGTAQTGVYTIEGDDATISDCGLCLLMVADMDKPNDQRRVFLAQAGTVNVLSLDGEVTAVANDVVFHELDNQTGLPIDNGCTSTAPSVTFDAELPAQ